MYVNLIFKHITTIHEDKNSGNYCSRVAFISCDSGIEVGDLSTHDSDEMVQTVRTYYEEFSKIYAKSSGDSIRTEVLAEMVRQYPPDWSQAVTWSDGQGGSHLVT